MKPKKINKVEVFVGCGHGQHPHSNIFKLGCNACIAATITNLVDILNLNIEEEPPKPGKVK